MGDAASLKGFPRTDRVLAHPVVAGVREQVGHLVARELVRAALDEARGRAREGGEAVPSEDAIASAVRRAADARLGRRTRRVVNATGVVLHTNLGRAPLGRAAVDALAREGAGYVSLEIDLASGKRGRRGAFAEDAIATLAGAEAALVVNNNAAAVLLALAALATGRAVLVSRGELVEIGGGFRVPEVLARSGARLVEVGTTNRTRVADYEEALAAHPDAAAILRVHPGNFRQIGFVERPGLAALAALGKARGLAVVEDLGGGALVPLPGLTGDPLVSESVAAGADLVAFSTDKILGGPQGGVLAGTLEAVGRARRDPLARALRLGRLPLVALEATLDAYLKGRAADVPTVAMMQRSLGALRARAEGWRAALAAEGVDCRVVDVRSVTGGGTYPGEEVPSVGIALEGGGAEGLLERLRTGADAVLARIEAGSVICDARTVLDEEEAALLCAVVAAMS